MTDPKYSKYVCTIPPDATKCPNFGYKYDEAITRVVSKNNDNSITVGHIGYAIKCELYGRIHITASLAAASTRCLFFFMLGADGYMIDCNGVTTHIHLSFYVVWRIVDSYRYI
jgi:hypothetical protein